MKKTFVSHSNSTQRSIWFHRSQTRRDSSDPSSQLYSHGLIQDLSLGMFPTRSTKNSSFPSVELSPPDRNLEEVFCRALQNGTDESDDLYDALDLFADDVARTIAYFGDAWYELVFFHNEVTGRDEFMLVQIPNWGLLKTPWFYVQRQLHYPQMANPKLTIKRVKIPKRSVIRFGIPGGFLAVTRYRRLLKRLGRLSKQNIPRRFLSPNSTKSTYDFSYHRSLQMVELARVSRHTGWTARQMYQDRINEFYYVYRYLRFERFRAQLRENIVRTINKTLQIAGQRLGFNSSVIVKGMPESHVIELAISGLMEGRIGFSSAIETTKPH